MRDFMYQISGHERTAFGENWCGPEQFKRGQKTLCAVYLPEEDGDGQKVEVYCLAAPARFYILKVLPRPNSVGEIQPGYNVHTASDAHEIAAALARGIARGMIAFEPVPEAGREVREHVHD